MRSEGQRACFDSKIRSLVCCLDCYRCLINMSNRDYFCTEPAMSSPPKETIIERYVSYGIGGAGNCRMSIQHSFCAHSSIYLARSTQASIIHSSSTRLANKVLGRPSQTLMKEKTVDAEGKVRRRSSTWSNISEGRRGSIVKALNAVLRRNSVGEVEEEERD